MTLAERVWEVSHGYDPYEFPISDKQEELERIEERLNDDPSVVIESLVWMMENME